jgi:hypothetical protein
MSDDTLSLLARYSMTAKIMDTGAFTDKDFAELGAYLAAFKTYDQYRSRLWSAAVRLFNGGRDAGFVSTFARTIDVELTKAWNEGAADVGVDPDEMTDADITIRDAIINNENQFIERIAGEIQDDAANGMDRERFDSKYGARIDLWANRYNETVNRARMQMGSKQRFVWRLGATEEHCETCQKLNGITAFGYEWDEARIHPQMPPNDAIECGGWRCDCSLEQTTRRRTARALDRLIEIRL